MAQLRPTSNKDRARLITAFIEGQNLNTASRILGIKLKTARHIVRCFEETGRTDALPRGGRKDARCKMDEEMRQELTNIVDANPFATLNIMREQLMERLPNKPAVSIATVARALEGSLYTFKIGTKDADV